MSAGEGLPCPRRARASGQPKAKARGFSATVRLARMFHESLAATTDRSRDGVSRIMRVKRRLQMHLASPTGPAHVAVPFDIMKKGSSATC
jgi:hypothetical protein